MTTVNLLFSMLGPRLTDDQASSFAGLAQWTVLHEREGRLLVDGIGDKPNIDLILGALAQFGRQPRIIGAWYPDGAPIAAYPFSLDNWLDVAPDLIDGEGNATRPTGFSEIHGWAGWAEKQVL